MDSRAQLVFAESSMESSESATALAEAFDDAEAVSRSERNILQWMKYLPEDCVARMIELGWDVTT
jgi:hypothetical protein